MYVVGTFCVAPNALHDRVVALGQLEFDTSLLVEVAFQPPFDPLAAYLVENGFTIFKDLLFVDLVCAFGGEVALGLPQADDC